MSKEQLEEIDVVHYESDEKGNQFVLLKENDYWYLQEQAERVQELEKEFELYDIIHHKIGMTVNNPNRSDDEKWEEVNKLLSEAWGSDCIHCNGKGFNGLDWCTQCNQKEGDPHESI